MSYEVALRTPRMSYDSAWLYCLTLSHNGHKDWRLPEFSEYSQSNMDVFDLCWYEGDVYFGNSEWHVVPVRDI